MALKPVYTGDMLTTTCPSMKKRSRQFQQEDASSLHTMTSFILIVGHNKRKLNMFEHVCVMCLKDENCVRLVAFEILYINPCRQCE